jgi:hypothetical protein
MNICTKIPGTAFFEVGLNRLIEMHGAVAQLVLVAGIEAFTKRFLNKKRHDY